MFLKYGEEDYNLLFCKSRYSIIIVNYLYSQKSPINHQRLADFLKIKKNNLSNIIRKLEPFDIIFAQKIGKNVYYSLTAKGIEFYDFIQTQHKTIPEPILQGGLELSFKK